jgi:hypothetical protein
VKRIGLPLLAIVLPLSVAAFSRLPRTTGTLDQPIAFSHKVHAGDYQLACLYCHANARRADVAGIPSMQFCMGCHKITAGDKPEIQKLKAYWDRHEPVRWVRVFYQPDFVHVSHRAHVRAGIACQACHGTVQAMHRFQHRVLITMDRCLACHRERGASVDCVTCHK